MNVTRKLIAPLMLALCACQAGGSADGDGQGGLGGTGGQGGLAIENPLGTLVECDQVLEDIIGIDPASEEETVRRRWVKLLPVADPTSVTITHCDIYDKVNGELLVPVIGGSRPDAECVSRGSWIFNGRTGFGGLVFTPDFEVYVECEEETTWRGRTSTIGAGRVYVRTQPRDPAPPAESQLGVAVECDEVLERTLRRRSNAEDGWLEAVERRKVAYIPVEDPTAVTITRCGYHAASNGSIPRPSADCVTSLEAPLTQDLEVIVECERETTYPVGWSGLEQGGVLVTGYERVYFRIDPKDATGALDNPLGMPVECDETYEWEYRPGTASASQYRVSAAFLPVADPTSVTLTRCDGSDDCVVSRVVSFTDDFEVYVRCEFEETARSGWPSFTLNYDPIYFRVD